MKKYRYKVYLAFIEEQGSSRSTSLKAYYTDDFFDELEIIEAGITLICYRSKGRNISRILTDYKSTINTQITKAIFYYIAVNGSIPRIDYIKIEETSPSGDKKEFIYDSDKLIQPFEGSLPDNLLIPEEKLSPLFLADKKANTILLALSLWIKGSKSNLAGDGFDRLWTSFNSLYSFISTGNNEFEKLKDMRNFILTNRDLFSESTRLFSEINDTELRKLRWRELVLNDYVNESNTKAFRDFILRYKDQRIMKVFSEILPYRKDFLSRKGYINEVESHISTFIEAGENDDHELLCLYLIKYSYFIRNKYFHGEKLDPTFYLIKTDEISELKFINTLFSTFIKELILANEKY
ncbi:hypothetical protein D3C76_794220 [compost metagenome]